MSRIGIKHFSNVAFMFDVKSSINQMASMNNDLEFDCFKAAPNEAIQRHGPIKKAVCSSEPSAFHE